MLPRLPDPPCWRVIFQAASPNMATIGLDVRHSLVVGRADPGVDEQPDLDLSPHQAAEQGVSRRHAELIPTEEALYLVDMDSTNGTWLNGSYLKPGQRRMLSLGDRVELGLLGLVVRSISRINRQGG
jgi:pSer/pThr/pTyr-binding forkhead associated (FHA) protein